MGTFYYKKHLGFLLAILFLGFWGEAQGQYCTPGYTNGACTSGDFIDFVEFGSINNNNTGCNNTSGNYTDFSATLSANVAVNQTYTMNVRSGSQFGQYFVAFIDLNQDQDFDDVGEFFDIGYSAAGTQISAPITIPGAALAGTTQLRVLCRFGTTALVQTDVCNANLSWGEVEDYGLVIAPPSALDMAMISLDSPLTACTLGPTENVAVTFANYGSTAATNPMVCYSINGGTPVCETFSGTIQPGDSANYVFTATAAIPGPGQYTFDSWVVLPGDGFALNDSLNGQIVEHLGQGLVSNIPYTEDFESGTNGWITYGDTNNTWQFGAPAATFINAAASGDSAWVTNLTGDYNNSEISYLQSPCMDLSGLTADPFVAFSHIYNTESCCDESWLELSTDAGLSWTKVGSQGTGNNWYNDAFAQEWDGDSGPGGAWRTADNRLIGAAGHGSVFLRYVFSSDGSVVREGFGVDDFSIRDTIINVGVTALVAPTNGCLFTTTEAVTIDIFNAGTHDATNIPVCFSVNGGAPICETVMVAVPAGSTYSYTFTGTADLTALGDYDFVAYSSLPGDALFDNDTTMQTVTSFQVYNTFPFVEDFESGAGGWTTYGDTNNTWELGVPGGAFIDASASDSNAWVTNLTGTYNNSEMSFLQSPCIDFSGLTADPFISFSHIYNTESCCDESWLEASTDGGVTWAKVGTQGTGNNWYNDGNAQEWDGDSGLPTEWRTADNRLDGLAGNSSVFLRYVFSSDGSVVREGFGIDDISIRDTIINVGAVAVSSPLNGCQLSATETVTVNILNAGSHPAFNFPVCFDVNGGSQICETISDTIQPGSTYTYTFTGTADLSVAGPYDVAVYTTMVTDSLYDNDTTVQSVTSFPVLNTFPYVEDFENGKGNWTDDGVNNDWGFGTPNKLNIFGAASGDSAWVTGTTGFVNYLPNQSSWVESPCFDMTNLTDPWVGANIWWESEGGFDGTVMEYSTDGGNTWGEVGTVNDPNNWYNDNSLNGLSNVGLTGNGWGGQLSNNAAPGQYIFAKHEVGFLAGEANVRFRMHFGSEGSVNYDGIAFDDFTIAQAPSVDLGNDTIVCSALTLTSTLPANGTFAWDSLSSGFPFTYDSVATVTITGTGTYILTYTDSIGICGSDTIDVTINTTPEVDLGPDQNICDGQSTLLTVDSAAYSTVNWSNATNGGSISVNTTGIWTVDVVDTVGCISSDTVFTGLVPLPIFTLGPDTSVCNGDTFCLTATPAGPGFTYLWSTGATTQTICSQIPSGYWAIATDSNGCAWADSVFFTPTFPVQASATVDTSNCPVIAFTDMSGTASTWFWNFGDGNTSTMANPTNDYTAAGGGTYAVTLVAGNVCGLDTTVINVDVTCLVSIEAPSEVNLSIYPNPNNGQFRLVTDLEGTVPVSVSITDLQGKIVYDRDFGINAGTFEEEVNLNEGASGVYFVRLKSGDQVEVRKIIVE